MWQGVTELIKGFSVKISANTKTDLALLIIRKIIVLDQTGWVALQLLVAFYQSANCYQIC